MTRQRDKQIRANLQAILDASRDLVSEVGVPDEAAELVGGPRINQLAFCECIRRVGEAAGQIDSVAEGWLNNTFPDVPWRDIKATRNLLTHHYWVVDYTILHTIATKHLPQVTGPLAAFLDEEDPCAAGRAAE